MQDRCDRWTGSDDWLARQSLPETAEIFKEMPGCDIAELLQALNGVVHGGFLRRQVSLDSASPECSILS